jgi:hypothetical protein
LARRFLLSKNLMIELSPAATAVLHAYQNADISDELSVAAVLRAAALYTKRDSLILLSIADELESSIFTTNL